MPNLDSIHYKFFPKSRTAPWGKKLIIMAWIIEILVATVSFSIAMLFFLSSGDSELRIAKVASTLNVNSIIVGLSFLVVTVIELTKIPLASVFYYAGKISWRITFFFALVAVNFLTFETIMQGFELAYNQRSSIVDDIRKQVETKQVEINNINLKSDITNLELDIKKVRDDIQLKNDEKSEVERQRIEKIASLSSQVEIADPNILRLDKVIERENEKLESYINERKGYQSDLVNMKGDFTGRKKRALKEQINKLNQDISTKESQIKKYEEELAQATGVSGGKNTSKIDAINKTADNRIKQINDQIELIEKNQLNPLLDLKSQNISTASNQKENFDRLNDELTKLKSNLKDAAKDSQIYRIAIKIKVFGEFLSGGNLENKISEIDQEILSLERSKFKKNFLIFFERDYEPSETFIALIDNKISVLEERKNSAVNQVLIGETKEIDEADLTQKDVDRAFWIWFGSMAFIISIIGSLVALAGFHLQDERMHEIRNRPIKERFARFFRNIAWIPVYINKYLWAGVKRLTKPKIVEKEVEKVVEKEKIVEKNIGEKIVYEKVEVPKEVVRKEMVYVPLPTDDEELLKRGPFTSVDKDKKK
jgi:hypothetical protein